MASSQPQPSLPSPPEFLVQSHAPEELRELSMASHYCDGQFDDKPGQHHLKEEAVARCRGVEGWRNGAQFEWWQAGISSSSKFGIGPPKATGVGDDHQRQCTPTVLLFRLGLLQCWSVEVHAKAKVASRGVCKVEVVVPELGEKVVQSATDGNFRGPRTGCPSDLFMHKMKETNPMLHKLGSTQAWTSVEQGNRHILQTS